MQTLSKYANFEVDNGYDGIWISLYLTTQLQQRNLFEPKNNYINKMTCVPIEDNV